MPGARSVDGARPCGALVLVWLAAGGCGEPERPGFLMTDAGRPPSDAAPRLEGGCSGPPELDAGDVCGNLVLPIDVPRRNVYFLIDRSGSMNERLEGGTYSKYISARIALKELLVQIGHRVHYGAAVFPGLSATDSCATGIEVFPTLPGDPLGAACGADVGPNLRSLLLGLGELGAHSGTPISPTLTAVSPIVTELPGETTVILATDGAPNCNPDARCAPDECVANLEGARFGDQVCGVDLDCCDPELLPDSGYYCVDRAASEAVLADWSAQGIRTFVIGMPGSERYASVLDRFAEAGGTARDAERRYYSVGNVAELTTTLLQIGASVAVSCSIELEAAPPDPSLVNVYFDLQLVPGDGWRWTATNALEIQGSACAQLKSGAVRQIQVVAGCPTVVY